MGLGEVIYLMTGSARCSRRKIWCNWMWKWEYGRAVEQHLKMCVRYHEWSGCESWEKSKKPRITQEMICCIHEQRNGGMSARKEERIEDWGMNWKDPPTSPKTNILRAYVMRSQNFKQQMLWFNVY